ncbi:MAG: MBL fold metallo-hydrolase [Chloroflexi bacterium]|nr:MBL fold metallo-hydrolase [Chloroflexota bacterium]
MLVRFWGTRGSVPTPGPATVRFGGNTACVEVRSGDSLAILDCGTGARGLGEKLASEQPSLKTQMFLSHVHWDHIQGFPFFLPVFQPNADLEITARPGWRWAWRNPCPARCNTPIFPSAWAIFARGSPSTRWERTPFKRASSRLPPNT